MKKIQGLLAALLTGLMFLIPACAEEHEQALPEWTVMFYLCGSDLESGHGYASGNLEEIASCLTYDTVSGRTAGNRDGMAGPEKVNVVIETGGSREWSTWGLGMNIRADALQRWHFRPARSTAEDVMKKLEQAETAGGTETLESLVSAFSGNAAMELTQELPLASMADPETLSDFIRWGAETCPAKKYALVLWGHGTGAVNGLLSDELFGDDTMRLDELKDSLADSGVHLEAVLFDACLMGSLETAWAIRDSADWMIASEELVNGKGTAIREWLQQLFYTPQWDGRRLGRWICEMTQLKYARETSPQAEDMLTWSVTDLKKIDRLAAAFDRFFGVCGSVYVNNPEYMRFICAILKDDFEFGLGDADMIDLSRIPYHPLSVMGLEEELYTELLDAVEEAVVYNTHGSSRATAGGLSFCYAAGASPQELDHYARVCPSVRYLALLDAIHADWEAPDRVYEETERLPEIADMPCYRIRAEKRIGPDGMPLVAIADGYSSLWSIRVDVSRLNLASGNIVRLGRGITDLTVDPDTKIVTRSIQNFPMWTALEGVHCSAELVSEDYLGRQLYHIPVMVGGETYMLRCGVEEPGKPPVIYGFWEGYSTDSGVFSRHVVPLSGMTGQDFTLLYPIDGTEGDIRYESSDPMTIYRDLNISSKPLEKGTYYLDYAVEDIFGRILPVGRAEVTWDGKKITVADGTWQGEMTLTQNIR